MLFRASVRRVNDQQCNIRTILIFDRENFQMILIHDQVLYFFLKSSNNAEIIKSGFFLNHQVHILLMVWKNN